MYFNCILRRFAKQSLKSFKGSFFGAPLFCLGQGLCIMGDGTSDVLAAFFLAWCSLSV